MYGSFAGASSYPSGKVGAVPSQEGEYTPSLESTNKRRCYDEKVQRVTSSLKKAKPSKAKSEVWAYFQMYASGQFSKYAICMICMRQKAYDKAEIKYSSSPSNLVSHLKTGLPGHREAWADLQRHKALQGRGGAYAGTPTAVADAAAATAAAITAAGSVKLGFPSDSQESPMAPGSAADPLRAFVRRSPASLEQGPTNGTSAAGTSSSSSSSNNNSSNNSNGSSSSNSNNIEGIIHGNSAARSNSNGSPRDAAAAAAATAVTGAEEPTPTETPRPATTARATEGSAHGITGAGTISSNSNTGSNGKSNSDSNIEGIVHESSAARSSSSCPRDAAAAAAAAAAGTRAEGPTPTETPRPAIAARAIIAAADAASAAADSAVAFAADEERRRHAEKVRRLTRCSKKDKPVHAKADVWAYYQVFFARFCWCWCWCCCCQGSV